MAQQAGLRSDVFVGIDFTRRVALILGTEYAGEMKKTIFSVMNYLLPRKGILTMHCSANVGPAGARRRWCRGRRGRGR